MTTSSLLSGRSVTTDLVATGVSLVDFPVEELVQHVVDGWLRFVEKSPEEKARWAFHNPNNPDDPKGVEGPDDGYICRDGGKRFDGVRYDVKEFFHYKRGLPGLLSKAGRKPRFMPEDLVWLEDMRTLHKKCEENFLITMAVLDAHFPGYDILAGAERGVELGMCTTRLLCYRSAQVSGEEIAKMHGDRNSLTNHLGDSVAGLVYKDRLGQIVEYAKTPGKTLLFPGKKLEKTLGEHMLPALRHGVIAKPEAIGKRRWTVVFFGHQDVILTPEEKSRP